MVSGQKLDAPSIRLRKENNIKTIQSSLAIEGNTITVEQITTLLDGQRVAAPQKDLIEVRNALEVYSQLANYNPLRVEDLLKAHRILMKNLGVSSGQYRSGGVGVFKGDKISHLPPPPDRVPHLMTDLFRYMEAEGEVPWLLKACIFHYEFEFIHPFEDGNGRMGRLWQQLLLMKEHPIFEYIAVEELIKEHQQDYYAALIKSDQEGSSTPFIEFSFRQIKDALSKYQSTAKSQTQNSKTRLSYARVYLDEKKFSRKQYMGIHPDISTATASRDLLGGVEKGFLRKVGKDNKTVYTFVFPK